MGTANARRSAVKTIAIAALCLLSLIKGGPFFLTLALGFSALGDYFLSRETDKTFLAGMAAFFLAHLAYLPLFLNLGGGAAVIAERWIIALALLVYAAGFYRFLWPGLGAFRVPVAAYSLAIAAMGLTALSLPMAGATGLVLAGAFLFVTSDSILAGAKFRPGALGFLSRPAPYLVWLTYWGAQALITFGSLPA
jgi:uncharacterized membrane protein YhhN